MAVADVDLDALPTPGSLIDGQMHTDPTDEIFPHLYAANGKLTHEVPLGGEAEMDAAVTAARKAFPAWKRMAPNDRRNLMTAFAREVRRQSDALARLMGFIDRATSAGCGLAFGGKRLGGELADGYFIQPTIFVDMDNSEEVTRQEIFGPVVSVLRFHSEEEAVAIANDTDYGLAAYIETTDLKRAHRVSAALDAGTVWVNGFFDLPVGAPFGGVKQSGFGRVGGQYGIQEFTRPKNVWMSL
jgi:acyl-CoA reductase-like NAD-dependent aldehyde dehydrogenase